MVKLEKPTFGTSTARPDEGAAAAVARPDLALDGRGDVPRSRRGLARGVWLRSGREFRLLEFLHQQRQRAIEDDRGIAIRHGVPDQILRAAQFLVRLARDSHFD